MTVIGKRIRFDKTSRDFINDSATQKAIMGAPASGKSTACCFAIKKIAELQVPDKNGVRRSKFLIIRRTNDNLLKTVVPTMRYWFETYVNMTGSITGKQKPEGKYTYGMADGTTVELVLIFKSLSSDQAEQDLTSYEVTSAWLNECNEIPESFISMIISRTGRYPIKETNGVGMVGSKMIYDFNPQDIEHWTSSYFSRPHSDEMAFYKQAPAILKKDSGLPRGEDHADYYVNPDAPNLSNTNNTYYRDLLAHLLAMGDYATLHNKYMLEYKESRDEDTIVFGKQFNLSRHVQETTPPQKYHEVLAGFDTSGNHPCIVLGQEINGQFHLQTGYFAEGQGREEFTQAVITSLRTNIYDKCTIYAFCDPHDGRDAHLATSSTDWYSAHGIVARKAPTNNLMARIDAVRLCLNHKLPDGRPYLVIDPKLDHLIKGLSTYYVFKTVKGYGTFKPIVTPNVDKGKTRPYSDWVDALQYLCLELSNRLHHKKGGNINFKNWGKPVIRFR